MKGKAEFDQQKVFFFKINQQSFLLLFFLRQFYFSMLNLNTTTEQHEVKSGHDSIKISDLVLLDLPYTKHLECNI